MRLSATWPFGLVPGAYLGGFGLVLFVDFLQCHKHAWVWNAVLGACLPYLSPLKSEIDASELMSNGPRCPFTVPPGLMANNYPSRADQHFGSALPVVGGGRLICAGLEAATSSGLTLPYKPRLLTAKLAMLLFSNKLQE